MSFKGVVGKGYGIILCQEKCIIKKRVYLIFLLRRELYLVFNDVSFMLTLPQCMDKDSDLRQHSLHFMLELIS